MQVSESEKYRTASSNVCGMYAMLGLYAISDCLSSDLLPLGTAAKWGETQAKGLLHRLTCSGWDSSRQRGCVMVGHSPVAVTSHKDVSSLDQGGCEITLDGRGQMLDA